MEKENLIGQIFGTIKVVNEAPNQNGKTAWHCQCIKCGTEKDIIGANLKNKKTRSCGCGCIIDEQQNLISTNSRICVICGKNFTIGINGHTRKYCYECSPSQSKNATAIRSTSYRQSVKRALVDYKGGKCVRCGYDKCINALQFHHLNPTEKDFTLSKSTKPFEELKAEVDKCILLCANCHAEIHYEENLSDLSL